MRNYTVAVIWGIPIRINVSLLVFLPVLAWIIGSGTQIETYAAVVDSFAPNPVEVSVLTAGSTPWVIGTTAAVGLFVSVGVHELGHAWAARRYGIGTESITLWLLGGIAALEEMPREWDREFWIAIAGPVTSVLTGVACYAVVLGLPAATPVATFVFGWLVVTNVALALFNLVPAFPMDGGRIFRAVLARSRPYETATRSAARLGTGFAVLFAVVGVLYLAPLLILLSLFIYGAASTESRTVALQGLLTGLTVSEVASMGVDPIEADATVAEFTERMLRERRTAYPVSDGGAIVGVLTLDDVQRSGSSDPETATVGSIVVEDVPRLRSDTPAFDGYVAISLHPAGIALVEDAGDVVGLVSMADYTDALQFRREGVGVEPRVAS